MARSFPPCLPPLPTTVAPGLADQPWHVDSLDGTIALPTGFRPTQSSSPNSKEPAWFGPDSSYVTVLGRQALQGLAFGRGYLEMGKPIGHSRRCAARWLGREVPLTATHSGAYTAHTLFTTEVSTVVRPNAGIVVMIITRAAGRETDLLSALQAFRFSVSRPQRRQRSRAQQVQPAAKLRSNTPAAESCCRIELAMNKQTWAALTARGVTTQTPLTLEFTFYARTQTTAEELKKLLAHVTDYAVDVKPDPASPDGQWVVEGHTQPTPVSPEILTMGCLDDPRRIELQLRVRRLGNSDNVRRTWMACAPRGRVTRSPFSSLLSALTLG